jgi:hypothetical protein
MALLQAWWRCTFPVDGHLSVDELVRGKLEPEAPSDVDAEVFLEELGKPAMEGLGEADGGVAAALLSTWWRSRVPDPDGWWACQSDLTLTLTLILTLTLALALTLTLTRWTQSVLDSGDAFWWRESEAAEGGMEVRPG